MVPRIRFLATLAVALGLASVACAGDLTESLKSGTPDVKSVGPLAFGPDGVLFIGDTQGAAIFAIDTGDRKDAKGSGPLRVEGVDGKIASMLGTSEKDLLINDMVVNPTSGNAYLSISRGKGPDAAPVLIRVDREGKLEEVSLKDVKFAKADMPNPAQAGKRMYAITKIAYLDGKVFVAGLSNEEFSSRLHVFAFPFTKTENGTNVEIFHGSHGKYETNSPIRTFASLEIKGEPNILAAYTCTPLVKIPVADLKPESKIRGVTVAELGNMNVPLDMVPYTKDGKNFILMANSRRGLMKVSTENIDKIEAITQRVKDKAGLTYETITTVKGVVQLDRLDKENALVLLKTDSGGLNIDTIALP